MLFRGMMLRFVLLMVGAMSVFIALLFVPGRMGSSRAGCSRSEC